MKRNIIFKALALALLCTAALQVQAQGIYVNKKSGESVAYPKTVFDRVTPDKQTSSEYGVRVYKQDGKYDYYKESELESITTYEEDFDQRITSIVPKEYLSKMSAYMPIYSGSTPPNIEGTYFFDPNVMIHNSDPNGKSQEGALLSGLNIKFTKQNTSYNIVNYQEENVEKGQVTYMSSEVSATILGEGDNFTAYFILESTSSDGSWYKLATIVSGTKAGNGIRNCFYGLLMLDKIDPGNKFMDVGTFRIFKDQDGLSEPSTWLTRSASARSLDTLLLKCYEKTAVLK